MIILQRFALWGKKTKMKTAIRRNNNHFIVTIPFHSSSHSQAWWNSSIKQLTAYGRTVKWQDTREMTSHGKVQKHLKNKEKTSAYLWHRHNRPHSSNSIWPKRLNTTDVEQWKFRVSVQGIRLLFNRWL